LSETITGKVYCHL